MTHEIELPQVYASLTKHPDGSFRELWAISFPLMLVGLSAHLMLFFDRLILANYSTEAMNSVVSAWMISGVFSFSVVSVAAIAEAFVGQINGARQYQRIGEPVWQMIWFSLLTFSFFIPLSIFGAQFFIPDNYETSGIPYFQWIMFFAPLQPLGVALASFFIGRGSTRIVIVSALITNAINIGLDYILIFGVDGFIPEMGAKGAAIATIISQVLGIAFFFYIFLLPKNRSKFGTHRFTFIWQEFWDMLCVGVPSATGHMIELAAWALLMQILATVSDDHMTVLSVGQSILLLAAFANMGLNKGTLAISANFIGARKPEKINKLLRSGVRLQFYLVAALIVPLFFYPEPLIQGFLPKHLGDTELMDSIKITLIFVWFYILIDGLGWITASVLTAARDTKFVMIVNASNAWLFALIPSYFYFTHLNGPPSMVWSCFLFYGSANLLIFGWRFKSGGWQKHIAKWA